MYLLSRSSYEQLVARYLPAFIFVDDVASDLGFISILRQHYDPFKTFTREAAFTECWARLASLELCDLLAFLALRTQSPQLPV